MFLLCKLNRKHLYTNKLLKMTGNQLSEQRTLRRIKQIYNADQNRVEWGKTAATKPQQEYMPRPCK